MLGAGLACAGPRVRVDPAELQAQADAILVKQVRLQEVQLRLPFRSDAAAAEEDAGESRVRAWLEGGQPVHVEEAIHLGDHGGSTRDYYFRAGELFLYEAQDRRALRRAYRRQVEEVWVRLLLAPGGRPLERSQLVDGHPAVLGDPEVEAIRAHAARLLRALQAKVAPPPSSEAPGRP